MYGNFRTEGTGVSEGVLQAMESQRAHLVNPIQERIACMSEIRDDDWGAGSEGIKTRTEIKKTIPD